MADGFNYRELGLKGKQQIDTTGKTKDGMASEAKKADKKNLNDGGLALFDMEKIDTNNDGVITASELKKAYKCNKKEANSILANLQKAMAKITKAEKNNKSNKTKEAAKTVSSKTNKKTGLTKTKNNDGTTTFTPDSKKSGAEKDVSVTWRESDDWPSTLSFDGHTITNVGTGGTKGNWFVDLKLDGKTYTRSSDEVKVDANGVQKYVLTPNPDDGTSVICKRDANGKQTYTIKDKNGNKTSSMMLDKNGKPLSVSKYNSEGKLIEKQFCQENRVRKYDYQDGKLTSSTDYKKDKNGKLNEEQPISSQKYEKVEGLGSTISEKTIYGYGKDGKQKVKNTVTYDYDVKNNNGKNTTTRTTNTYKGKISKDEKPVQTSTKVTVQGKTQSNSITDVKNNSTTVKNDDGTTTITKIDDKTGFKTTETRGKNGKLTKRVKEDKNGTTTTEFKNDKKTKRVREENDGTKTTTSYKDGEKTKSVAEKKDGTKITSTYKNGVERKRVKESKDGTITTTYFNKAGKKIGQSVIEHSLARQEQIDLRVGNEWKHISNDRMEEITNLLKDHGHENIQTLDSSAKIEIIRAALTAGEIKL